MGEWRILCDRGKDIHFVPEYARGFEKHEGGTVSVYRHRSSFGEVSHLFIRRKIPVSGFEEYSDILTPYGYGGPIVERCDPNREKELAQEYRLAFDRYCKEEKIICNFTRFHPLFQNHILFSGCYDEVTAIRDIVIVDLSKDVFCEEFEKEARRYYRKYDGIFHVRLDPECVHLKDFIDIYYDTMDKNAAKPFYYFQRSYFEELVKRNEGHVFLCHAFMGDKIIASKLLLAEGDAVYSQFGGTRKGCYEYNAYSYLFAKYLLEIEKTGKYRWAVLGGGVSNRKDDGVLRFKKHFSRSLYPFYIGKRVYNREAYEKICDAAGTKAGTDDDSFFPAYRSR